MSGLCNFWLHIHVCIYIHTHLYVCMYVHYILQKFFNVHYQRKNIKEKVTMARNYMKITMQIVNLLTGVGWIFLYVICWLNVKVAKIDSNFRFLDKHPVYEKHRISNDRRDLRYDPNLLHWQEPKREESILHKRYETVQNHREYIKIEKFWTRAIARHTTIARLRVHCWVKIYKNMSTTRKWRNIKVKGKNMCVYLEKEKTVELSV